MNHYYSGADGKLLLNGRKVAKVKDWTLDGQVGSLPVTSLGDTAEDYTAGIKSGSGTCSVWYYDDAPAEILSKIFKTTAVTDNDKVQAEFGWGDKKVRATIMFTTASLRSQVSDVMVADCRFTVCGDLLEVSL